MIKDNVIQFVCFATNIAPEKFIIEWEPYAKKLQFKKQETNLLELVTEVKNKYRYISRHEWPGADFNFSFMTKTRAENFPDQHVRVVQAGGYKLLPSKKKYTEEDTDVKLIAFINHKETDIDFYTHLPLFHHLDIFQAYYESCAYGYILEFGITETNADELLRQLQQRPGVEAAIYKECNVLGLKLRTATA